MSLKTTDSDADFIAAAREQYQDDGTLEVDHGAAVSRGDDPGHYVQAWVWVDAEYPTDEELEAMDAANEVQEQERQQLVERLIEDDITNIRQMLLEDDDSYLRSILRHGEKGLGATDVDALRRLAQGRGLINETDDSEEAA
ncbi:hypothetical protein [Halomonas sp. I5-271120]|uniref:hypothetical protein n=1 Tax=Halomonas sp. I5-271120 TaxID=3061632 RepID=UPI002714825E|nr:hypothetical protein [Halomonas sp. I5-271120]